MQVYTYHSARYLHYVKHIHQRRALNSPPPSFLPASLPFLPPYLLDLASQFAYSDARTRLRSQSKRDREMAAAWQPGRNLKTCLPL